MPDTPISSTVNFKIVGVKELHEFIDLLAKMQSGAALSDKELSKLEATSVKLSLGSREAAASLKTQTRQVDSLTRSLQRLGITQTQMVSTGSKQGSFAIPELASRISLIRQQAVETEKAADAVRRFHEYQRGSNTRQATLEQKDLIATQKTVTREMEAEANRRRQILEREGQFHAYQRASNARMAAQEAKDIAGAQRAVTKEMQAEAKKRQEVAFQSYANNMPGALKQAQNAAFQSYATNVQYSKSIAQINEGLSNQRYALYDVATTMGIVSLATLGTVTAIESLGISFEKNFASVERTSGLVGDQLENLRSQLVNISTTMPIAFSDVTQIATLGAQLGIAGENLDSFTNTIAQFGATTDVSTQKAAEGFGRLGELTNVPADEFANLGSAIYQVGITSVATESQILAVAQQIAVAGNLAGFSADEIVALAGALASLGVQPEAARGSIARIFNSISNAAQEGGDSLNKFAEISGTTAGEFASQWGSNPQAAFGKFITGLGEAADRGEFLSGILSDLGLNAVRDQNALKLLADNTEVYNKALSTSSTAYAEGTALADGYQVVADTLAAKLQVLAQTLVAAADAASNLGVVKDVVGLLQTFAEWLKSIADSDVGKVFATVGLGLLALTGIFTGYVAMQTLATASAYALRVAQNSLHAETGKSVIGVRALSQELLRIVPAANSASVALAAYNAELAAGSGRMSAFRTAMSATATGASSLGTALKGIGVFSLAGLGITAALIVLPKLIEEVTYAFSSGSEKAEKYFGDLSGLTDALKTDTKEGGEAFRTISAAVTESSQELAPWARDLQIASGAQVGLNDATAITNESVRQQTIIIGENAKAWLANALANDRAFQDVYMKNAAALKAAGFDLQTFLNATLTSDGGGVAYLQGLNTELTKISSDALSASYSAGALDEELQNTIGTAASGSAAVNDLMKAAQAMDGAFTGAAQTAAFTAEINEALGISAERASDELAVEDGSLQNIIQSALGASDALYGMNNAVFNLGKSMQENGTSFDAYSEAGRANLASLQSTISAIVVAAGGDAQRLAAMLAGLMDALAKYGVNTVSDLASVQAAIARITGGKGVTNLAAQTQAAAAAGNLLGQGFSSGAKGVKKAGSAAKTAQKEIKTLSDYVDDLSGVFSKSFDIRFGLEESIDKVADAYQKLSDYSSDAADAVEDAKQAISQADSEIRGLSAANTTLSYQLTVAQEYGDTLRANEILAKLAENNAEIAEKEEDRVASSRDLAKAQNALNKSLDGGTVESREQRDMVLGLVKSYQDQITALANSGLSQADLARRTQELKNQFAAQLTQMGYSRAEVDRYSASFDDLTAAINRVPRIITVTANTDPAQRAIDEFLARNANHGVGTNLNVPDAGSTYGLGRSAGDAYAVGWNEAVNARRRLVVVVDNNIPGGKRYSTDGGANWFFNKGGVVPEYHSTGGVHGLGFKSRGTDTTPAMLTPGEYVQQRSAVDYYGLPFMNALNNMQVPRYLAGGGSSSGRTSSAPGIQIVELVPNQLSQLARMVSTQVSLDGKVVAEATNNANTVSARRGSN